MMSRISQFGTRARLLSLLTAAVLLCAVPQSATAAGYVYQQHTVNAGVLYPGSAGDLAVANPSFPAIPVVGDPAPYLFYVLNNRPDARPTDLALVNPQAPQTVTPGMARRWGYAQGIPVTPSMAGYWEVPLHDISSAELQQYDVLYLAASGDTFSPADNEKLRRFVDSGGQLFVEYGSGAGNPGLFTGTSGAIVAGTSTLTLPPVGSSFLRHPLLSQPYLLSPMEISTLATLNGTVTYANDGVNLFGPVLLNGNPAAVIAGQLGAGQVVVSALDLGGIIGAGNVGAVAGVGDNRNYLASGTTPTPANFSGVPAADLKFLSNLISWSETHPNENKTSHGNASANGLSAFSTSWLFGIKPAGTNPPPAAVVWGNFVFAVDTSGTLHGFNAYPGSNLTGPLNGSEPTTTYPANAYDDRWNVNVGVGSSSPTVATHRDPTTLISKTYVFVEAKDGSILSFDAVTGGASGLTFTKPTDANNYTGLSYPVAGLPVPGLLNAPSPTYYDGRLYAGQANGTLSIYDLNDGTSANIPLNPTSTAGESVLGPPSIGLLPNGDTNILTAIVPGVNNIYTVLLGARNEPLVQFPPRPAAPLGYRIDHFVRYGLPTLLIDANPLTVPPPIPYYSSGVAYTPLVPAATTNPQDPLFAITDYNSFYTDWNMDFVQTVQSNPQTLANLSLISANTVLSLNNTPPPPGGTFSVPAIDRHGDYYYTLTTPSTGGANSYLVGVQNAPLSSNVQLKFRFRMPAANDGTKYADPTSGAPWQLNDADGVDYNPLANSNYTFVGAPVVDDQGNVYVAAVGGTQATVLCFKGSQGASADNSHFVGTAQTGIDLNQASFQQADEGGAGQNNALGTSGGQQFTVNTIGNLVTFTSFGHTGSSTQQIAGNLNEPEPVQIQPVGQTTTFTNASLLLHTNLSWYALPFTFSGTLTGLSKVGNSLFLTDGNTLYSLPATPTVGPGKIAQIAPSRTPLGLSTVSAPPSIGGSVMAVNGLNGIGVLTRQVTVVADNHRILGIDGNGGAIWSVDATTRTAANGSVSKVPFSHPVSLSQFADNEFLVADTGNNRCVRFDSGGNVQWELTRFSDPNGLMAPGQPVTLSQPTSVEPHIVPISTTAAVNPGGTITYYLVADSGNDRIVEVADITDANGNIYVPASGIPQSHILTWVTHTADQSGRRYRYGSATYFQPSPTAPLSIAATVTNARVGPLTGTAQPYALGSASSDAPGGCLVVFNETVPQAAFSASPPNDLVYVAPGFYTASAAATPVYTPYTIRNPRFLSLYTPAVAPPVGSPQYNFLYTDDNGAFDLSFDTAKNAYVAEPGSLQMLNDTSGAGTVGSYQYMTTPINAQGVGALPTATPPDQPFDRKTFPFVPTCIQRFGADGSGFPHYLITQTYSQGEVSGRPGSNYGAATGAVPPNAYIPPGFGGEVFEAFYDTVAASPTYQKFIGVGSYAGHTLSRPTLTGPLTQPTFAVRLP